MDGFCNMFAHESCSDLSAKDLRFSSVALSCFVFGSAAVWCHTSFFWVPRSLTTFSCQLCGSTVREEELRTIFVCARDPIERRNLLTTYLNRSGFSWFSKNFESAKGSQHQSSRILCTSAVECVKVSTLNAQS